MKKTASLDPSEAVLVSNHRELPKISKVQNLVPRAGIEPARLAATVFETVASTYSATWANTAPQFFALQRFIRRDSHKMSAAQLQRAAYYPRFLAALQLQCKKPAFVSPISITTCHRS